MLFASCIRVDGKIKIEDDGSGNVDFLSALNTEALGSVLGDFDIPEAELGGSDELCADFESEFGATDDLPPGARVTPYNEDGFCGARVEYALAPSTDHSASVRDLLDDEMLKSEQSVHPSIRRWRESAPPTSSPSRSCVTPA